MEQAIRADSSGMGTHNYYVLHSVKAHRRQIGTYMLSLQLWQGRHCDTGIITCDPRQKNSLLLKVWEGRGCKILSPSLLNPLPVLGKHTSVRYHLRYQVIFITGFSRLYMQLLSCWFWVVVTGLFYGIIFLKNGIDVHFKMLQMILMNTDIREIPPTRYDPFYLLCVMRLLPFNSIHSLLLVCYMHTCMCVCGSVMWMCVHMCVCDTAVIG